MASNGEEVDVRGELGGIGLIGLVVHGAFGTPPFARQTLTGRARWLVKTVAGLTAAAF
jgi:hypothetical protein